MHRIASCSVMFFLGCASAPSSPASLEPPAVARVEVDGRVAYRGTLDEAPEDVRALHEALERVVAAEIEPPADPTLADYQRWTQSELTLFIAAQRERLGELERQARELASSGDPDARVFATIVVAYAWQRLYDFFERMPVPRELADDERLASVFLESMRSTAVPVAHRAAAAYRACATADAPAATASEWRAECAARAEALGDLEAPERRAAAPAIEWPPECASAERYRAAPEAPAPDRSQPEALVVRLTGDVLDEAGRARLLEAVRAKLAERSDVGEVVPQRAIDAAERLRSRRRVRAGGPRCGQPPPLGWVLSEQHANLLYADVRASCGRAHLQALVVGGEQQGAADERGVDLEGQRADGCELRVSFWRPGAPEARTLPAPLLAEVTDRSVEGWTAAVERLDVDRSSMGVLMGALGGASTLRVSGDDDEDPWLRVASLLREQRDALAACAPREGRDANAFSVRFEVSPTGRSSALEVTPATNATDAQAACVRAALEELGWPCTPLAEAQQVDVRLCLAPASAEE